MKKLLLIGILFALAACTSNKNGNAFMADENQTFTINDISYEMIAVKGGTFMMGAQRTNPNGINYDTLAQDNEAPVHEVTLSDYYIGKHCVTVEEFSEFIKETGYRTTADKKGGLILINRQRSERVQGLNWQHGVDGKLRGEEENNHPVIFVSWDDAMTYCKWLKKKTGLNFCLPTEAQWEFAAKGGNLSKGYKYSGSDSLDDVAWYRYNSDGKTHPVCMKTPNELGIYDMSGNIDEWCYDWIDMYLPIAQKDPVKAKRTSNSYNRVRRGGYYDSEEYGCRTTTRMNNGPENGYNWVGFRVAISK